MLYKITLKQNTGFIGKIIANTLLGAFLTAYSTLKDITEKDIMDIVFSDLFKGGILPIGVKDNSTIYPKGELPITENITRTMIARDIEDNNIINPMQSVYYGKSVFYMSTDLIDKTTLEKIIPIMLKFGLGKWRNVGKGQFTLISIEEVETDTTTKDRIALCNFIPENNGYGSIKETGYAFRDAIATNGIHQQKVCMLLTGTKINTDKQFIGKHIFDEASKTYIHGKTILL